MIGRLLQTAASTFSHQSATRPQTPLESVTEEAHTRDLLFPDINALRANLQNELGFQQARHATARDALNSDDRGNLDISCPADIRIIIAQDANSRYHQPQVLFDSKPHKGSDSRSGSPLNEHDPTVRQTLSLRGKSMTSPTKRGHNSTNSLFSSAQIVPLSPTSPRSPEARRSFFGERTRPSPFDFGPSEHETAQGKLAREAKEETDALLGCMFGAPGFRLEPSTKLHVVPKKAPESTKSPGTGTRPISSGGFNRRRTPLVRSTSAADFSNGWSPSAGNDGPDSRPAGSRPAVMVTRLFSVNLPESGTTETEEDQHSSSPTTPSNIGDSFAAHKAAQQKNVKQKKVPMYAIAIVLQLPPDGNPRLRSSPSHAGLSSLGSSLNDSTPANSWRAEQSAFSSFMEIRAQTSFDSVINPHIAQVLQHWNVLSRSIELLEFFAKVKLTVLLEQCAPPTLAPAPQPKPGLAKLKKTNKQSQQSVYVVADCFQNDPQIKRSTETAAQTIISGLKTRRVVVGQGRWGAWREEARWVGRWAGGRDQNFFFFNFLTAFLGSHTAWLESFSPAWYRRRCAAQKRINGRDSSRIQHRTVIVSSDKMAARRLIFLLAIFFPSNFNHVQPLLSGFSSSQNNQYSDSPPVPSVLKDQSLRRSATAHNRTSIRRSGDDSKHRRAVSFSLMGAGDDGESAVTETFLSIDRQDSDGKSLRSPSLAMPRGSSDSRKASLSTVTAEVAEAIPHFSNLPIGNPDTPTTEKRPGSGGSMASNALSQTLRRSESSTLSTSASGRWGSVVSGFWSNRRDSTDDSDFFPSSSESPSKRRTERLSSANVMARMVEEADSSRDQMAQRGSPNATVMPRRLEDCLKPQHPANPDGNSVARSIPRRPKPERLPLKLSFNENDGYIDVAMPATQSFSSSLASSFASIRLPTHNVASSNEHYSPYGSVASDSPHPKGEPSIDVAGWLKTYHPDFTVQAVKPYDSLMNDIKTSMYSEAQLLGHSDPEAAQRGPQWVDVCTTLLADTNNFSVTRMTLRRRPRSTLKSPYQRSTQNETFARPASPRFADPNFETEIISEKVMDLDATLIDAVERVLAQSGTSSRAPSRAPSRPGTPPRSPRAESIRSSRTTATSRRGTDIGYGVEGLNVEQAHLEVPSGDCRRMVLGALEEVVRSVVEEKEIEDRTKFKTQSMTGQDGTQEVQSQGYSQATPRQSQTQDQMQSQATSGDIDKKGSVRSRGKRREMDSTLREGVRKWLVGIEEGW